VWWFGGGGFLEAQGLQEMGNFDSGVGEIIQNFPLVILFNSISIVV